MASMVVSVGNPSALFWEGRRVLVTGHTGFKGAWLAYLLQRLGAQVFGVGLAPATAPNLYDLLQLDSLVVGSQCDIRDAEAMSGVVSAADPQIVFHLAAQALVRPSYRDPLETMSTNVLGTANVLEAARTAPGVRVVVVITTDKVYRNLEESFPYRETDVLGGHDPYSASKAAAELVVSSWRESFLRQKGVRVATARAGNVIGGGDWAEDRLLPDAIRAWTEGQPLAVRRPLAIRPWQHVLDPLVGYLRLAERLWDDEGLCEAWNFGPNTDAAATVREVILLAREAFGRGEIAWGDGSEGPHEAGWLTLEIAKARARLGFSPRWTLQQAITRTMDWYRRQADGESARSLCDSDIAAYAALS